MPGSYEVFSHTADTGIAVEADTLAELVEYAAEGMFGLMYDVGGGKPDREIEFLVAAPSLADLLVDTLSELLYFSEADDLVPCTFTVPEVTETRLCMRAGVVPLRDDLQVGPPIKAVTYHDLVVGQTADRRWAARLVFDV
jgi:SHS2 domain-containing protein